MKPMSSLSSHLATVSNRRRSQRVLLRIPIDVIARGPDDIHTTESTHTAVVNAHGALIHLSLKVNVGQVIVVKNPETGEEQACRIARCTPAPDGKNEVGIEFVQPAPHFWRISFPPADWTPRHPEITSDTF
jgi:hypothetical protein